MGKNHTDLQEPTAGYTFPLIDCADSNATYPAQPDSSAPGESTSCRQQREVTTPGASFSPGLNLSLLAIHSQLRGTVLETELHSENKKRLKRRDEQEAVGRTTGGWRVLNSPMQRKGPAHCCRRSGLLPHRVPCGFHWNYRLRWVNPPGKGEKSLRKSFHPLIIQKCPWLPSEGVCTLPHSDSPQGPGQVLSKPLTAKSALANSDCLGFFVEKCTPSMMGGQGAAAGPRPAWHTRSQLAFPSPEAVPNASRFLKQTQQRFIKAQHAGHKAQRGAEPANTWVPSPDQDRRCTF